MSFDSMGGLLDHFLDAVNYLTGFGPTKGSKDLNKKITDLVSKQFFCDGHSPSKDPYTHSLTPADVMPLTKHFWHNKKTTVIGSPPNTAIPANRPHNFHCS